MDAFAFGTTAKPRDAYRYAQGGVLEHPAGFDMQLRAPLDLYAVTDHAPSMGSDLPGDDGRVPPFFAQAIRDPQGAPLQRLQIVKGWAADGETFEQVYDVACSDGGTPAPATHRCPRTEARVDIRDCSSKKGFGAGELRAV